MRLQRIIFECGPDIPSINSTITDDSGNFGVTGLRVPVTEGYYNTELFMNEGLDIIHRHLV
jgi:hypothetical protein